ncbi:MAG: hypothetical protein U0840_28050 [Gemmataceae bacterium]
MTDSPCTPQRWTLRDLPFAARLALAVFLMSVGIGYISALVNLHFASAKPGEPLPTPDDAVAEFHAGLGASQLERLIEAHPNLPFNGQGSMRSAFTTRAGGWDKARKTKAKEMSLDLEKPDEYKKASDAVARDLEGERRAMLAWIKMTDTEKQKQAYDDDRFELPAGLTSQPITSRYVEEENGQRFAKIKGIFDGRCKRCHSESVGGAGSHYPLDNYEEISLYLKTESGNGKSVAKLALTTHVHLLGFSMLYGLTGLLLALTGWPALIRVPLAPLALLAQIADISFWWLARLDGAQGEMFARLIPVSGGIVAMALMLQIVLTLYALFGRFGKVVLTALIIAAALGAFQAKQQFLDPYLAAEREGTHQTP